MKTRSLRSAPVTITAAVLVLVLVILVSVVVSNSGSPHGNGGAHPTTSLNPILAGDVVSACKADANILQIAVSAYDAQEPTQIGDETGITVGDPATYSQGVQARKLLKGGLFLSKSYWPDSQYYSMSYSQTFPGDVTIYIPPTSTHGVSYDNETKTTGCNSFLHP